MTTPATVAAREKCAERVMNSVAGALALFTGYIGDRLGLYTALAQNGPMTSEQLAQRTGTHERYIREWLEQQTWRASFPWTTPERVRRQRQYRLPAGHDEVLTDTESLNYLRPVFQLIAGIAKPLPEILEAFRTGKGVPYTSYGEMHEGQGRMNRTIFLQQLPEWLASIPVLHAHLQAAERPRIADIGCGHGWSGIGMARHIRMQRSTDSISTKHPSAAPCSTRSGKGSAIGCASGFAMRRTASSLADMTWSSRSSVCTTCRTRWARFGRCAAWPTSLAK
jgi:hypothetical protein